MTAVRPAASTMISLHGISASKGIAIGKILVVERGHVEVPENRLPKAKVEAEVTRYRQALKLAGEQLKTIQAEIPAATARDVTAFIDTHLLMLDDASMRKVPIKLIRDERCNAEWALKMQHDALLRVFDAMEDPYLRTRRDDVSHVVNRVLRILLERRSGARRKARPSMKGQIIFADDLSPADTVMMQHRGIAALITVYGGPTSHTAILSRSLRIPSVVGLRNARPYLCDDDTVIVDGREGVVLVHPDDITLRHYEKLYRRMDRMHSERKKLKNAPAVSADGKTIGLQANVELTADIDLLDKVGAAGVGLYRTEFLFMNRDEPPNEKEQFAAYTHLASKMPGRPITIRTLDLGADKQVDGSRPNTPNTTNPALGLRAVRLCLSDQNLFRPQIRAILRVSADNPVRMMIPMLSNTQELVQVMEIIKSCQQELKTEGYAFDENMPVGAMIEVPAAAVCADIFARHLDFLSIGTNDLIQYTIAVDRMDDAVNYLYEPLHPAVLRLVQTTIRAGQKAGIPVAMCGEMAGDSRYTRLLLGLGLKEFSVHPNALLEVKQVIKASHIGNLRKLAQRIMRAVKTSTRDALLEEMNQGPDA